MVYYVYTDASLNEEKGQAACAFMILSEGKFITAGCETYALLSSKDAEAKAIAVATSSLKDYVKAEDTVRYYIDNVNVFKATRAYSRKRSLSDVVSVYGYNVGNFCVEVSKVAEVCKVEAIKVQAHTGKQCGNTAVDRLARYTLKYKLRKNEGAGNVCSSC